MAMNFNRPAGAPTTAVAAKPETALMEVQPYDIIADQQATQKQLAHSPEIESLTAGIDVNDLNTIVTFGSHSAEEISKASDHAKRGKRRPLHGGSGQRGRLCQRLDALHGRRRIRPRLRDGHLHAEAPRARADRPERADDLSVCYHRKRSDQEVSA